MKYVPSAKNKSILSTSEKPRKNNLSSNMICTKLIVTWWLQSVGSRNGPTICTLMITHHIFIKVTQCLRPLTIQCYWKTISASQTWWKIGTSKLWTFSCSSSWKNCTLEVPKSDTSGKTANSVMWTKSNSRKSRIKPCN